MSSTGDGEDGVAADAVVLEITDASSFSTVGAPPSTPRPSPIPVSALASLDDPLPSPTVAVRADRSRLIESSSYFRALLGGSFSESGRGYVQISCNLEAAVQVLRYLFEPSASLTITHENFLPLLEEVLGWYLCQRQGRHQRRAVSCISSVAGSKNCIRESRTNIICCVFRRSQVYWTAEFCTGLGCYVTGSGGVPLLSLRL